MDTRCYVVLAVAWTDQVNLLQRLHSSHARAFEAGLS